MMAKWTHLFSSRTQKLSTSAATIAKLALVKIAHCQVLLGHILVSLFFFVSLLLLTPLGCFFYFRNLFISRGLLLTEA